MRNLVGAIFAIAIVGTTCISANAEPLSIGQEVLVTSSDSAMALTSGSFKISIEGFHIIDSITRYESNGMAVLGVQCAIENIDFSDLYLDNQNISSYDVSEFVRVVDSEGFDCEFYNLDDSQGDDGYAVGKNIRQGSKAKVSLTYYIQPNTESFSIDVGDVYHMDCKLDKFGEGIITEQDEALTEAEGEETSSEDMTDNGEDGSADTVIDDSPEETQGDDLNTDAPDITEPSKDVINVLDLEGIKIYIDGCDFKDSYEKTINLKIENLNHHNICVMMTDAQAIVNGIAVEASLYAQVKSGRKTNAKMFIFSDALKANDIGDIKTLSFKVDVEDDDSYSLLYQSKEVFLTIVDDSTLEERVVYTDKDSIRKVQELLNAAGYDCGAADGVAGKNTNNAILKFERDHGLDENTDITNELLEALENATK